MDKKIRCEFCKYNKNETCRRYPPIDSNGQPAINNSGWCGEFVENDLVE